MSHPAPPSPPPEAVGPLLRGLAVLRALTDAGGRDAVADLARTTGLARSTVDRVLSTLQRMEYLRLEGRDAVLAPRLMELGNAYLTICRLPDLLGPLAERLADELDESVSIAVPDRQYVRFVHQSPRRRAMSLTFRIGDPLPAERGAPGALFAAEWGPRDWAHWRDSGGREEDRADFAARTAAAAEDDVSVDDQLIEPGLIAVAVPVRDPAGRRVGAVSVVSHTSRHSAESLAAAVLPRLRSTVAAMEQALTAPPPPSAPPVATAARAPAWTRASKLELGPEFVESLARGLTVLTALGHGTTALPLAAVAGTTGLARATARRALITLGHLGYVETDGADGRLFLPTPRVLELGFAHLSRLTLPQIARPHLTDLVRRVQDSASMAVLTDREILYVARVPTVRIMSVSISVGTLLPAYATAMGRVLLADLAPDERATRLGDSDGVLTALTRDTVTDPDRLAAILAQVRDQGYALVDEELEEGLRSLAVPVRDRAGRAVAAVNVSLHAGRAPAEESAAELLPPLREAAARIEADLHTASRHVRVPLR